jgi:hypothetical protein
MTIPEIRARLALLQEMLRSLEECLKNTPQTPQTPQPTRH